MTNERSLRETILTMDIDALSPIEALTRLYELRRLAQAEQREEAKPQKVYGVYVLSLLKDYTLGFYSNQNLARQAAVNDAKEQYAQITWAEDGMYGRVWALSLAYEIKEMEVQS